MASVLRFDQWRMPALGTVLIALVLGAQLLLATFTGTHQIAWLVQAGLLLLVAGGLAAARLLDEDALAHGRYLLPAALVAGWLVVVQLNAISQPATEVWSLAWWAALALVPVARYCWTRRLAGWLLAAVLLPAAVVGFSRALLALGDPAGHRATIIDSNLVATRLGLTLLLVVALAAIVAKRLDLGRSGRGLLLLGLGMLTAFIAMLVQQALWARAVMFMLPLGLVCVAWVSGQRSWMLLALLPIGVYSLVWLFPELATFREHGSVVAPGAFGSAAVDRAAGSRMILWQAALGLLPAYWLLGAGLGGFALLYPGLRGAEDRTFGYMVHNDWLQLLLEAGVPMFLALVGFALVVAICWGRLGVRLLRAGPAPSAGWSDALLGFTALTMVGWILGHALINFPLYDPTLLNVMIVCGVVGISAAGRDSRVDPSPEAPSPIPGRAASRTVRLGLWAVFLVLGLMWLRVAGYAVAMVTLVDRPPFPGVAPLELSQSAHFSMAGHLRRLGLGHGVPGHIQAAWAAEVWRQNDGNVPEALVHIALDGFEEAERLDPWPEEHYLDHARFLEELGGYPLEERIAILERGLERNPFYTRLWLAVANQYERAGRFEGSVVESVVSGWLPTCYFGSYIYRDDARELFAMLPEDVLKSHGGLAERCELALQRPDHVGVVRRR